MKKSRFINNIKVIIISILSTIFIVSFSRCSTYQNQGLENFGQCDSAQKITMCMIPENMLTEFEYIDGNYYYYDPGVFGGLKKPETAFMYLVYDKQTYPLAKEYMLENINYTEDNLQSYNGYEFYDNLNFARRYNLLDSDGKNNGFLYWFNMIGYSDDKNTLVFMGYSYWNINKPKRLVEEQGWGAFLKECYPYYDFDA